MAALIVLAGCANTTAPGAARVSTPPMDPDLYDGLDGRDLDLAHSGVQQALEMGSSGVALRWVNASSGNAGAITPLSTFRTSTGYYCRRYRETVIRGRRGEARAVRTACRDDFGVWRQVEF
ncbi:MAG: RT0821/Lpp0805 family surface protein [Alphaproteobacteria bacterium]